MSNFGNLYDPRKELLKALQPTLSRYADPFSIKALSRRALEQVQTDALRAATSAQATIDKMESLSRLNLASLGAEADEALNLAMSETLNPPRLSEAVDQAKANTRRTAANWRQAQDDVTRALPAHWPDFSKVISGANVAYGFDEKSLLETMSTSALGGPNLAGSFSELLDATNFYNQMFGADTLAKTIERFASETYFPDLAGIGLDAVSGLPPHVLGKAILESIAPWTTNIALAEQLDRELGLDSYSRQFFEALSREEYSDIEAVALDIAERFAEKLDGEPVSSQSIQEAVESAPILQCAETLKSILARLEANAKSENRWHKKHPVLLTLLVGLAMPLLHDAIALRVGSQPGLSDAKNRTASESGALRTVVANPAYGRLLVVVPEILHLRAGPSAADSLVSKLQRGQLVRLISQDLEWGLVLYVDPLANSVSYTGWVKLSYTRTLEDETARLLLDEMTSKKPSGRD